MEITSPSDDYIPNNQELLFKSLLENAQNNSKKTQPKNPQADPFAHFQQFIEGGGTLEDFVKKTLLGDAALTTNTAATSSAVSPTGSTLSWINPFTNLIQQPKQTADASQSMTQQNPYSPNLIPKFLTKG